MKPAAWLGERETIHDYGYEGTLNVTMKESRLELALEELLARILLEPAERLGDVRSDGRLLRDD